MVRGLKLFTEHFRSYEDQYVLIGGAACDVAMENVGEAFRATKDLDIVLCGDIRVGAEWHLLKET